MALAINMFKKILLLHTKMYTFDTQTQEYHLKHPNLLLKMSVNIFLDKDVACIDKWNHVGNY